MNSLSIGIVNLRLHNLFSIFQACKNIGYKTSIIEPKDKKYNYDMVILPGVGSYKAAMKFLEQNKMDQKLIEFSLKGKFLFGICLGMQLLFDKSEEFGNTRGLGLIQGQVKKIKEKKNIKIPHIGWNEIRINSNKGNFLNNSFSNKKFYFVHSFFCKPTNENEICSFTTYGEQKFCSAVRKNNIIGTQFHPEKSSSHGLKVLKNLNKLF